MATAPHYSPAQAQDLTHTRCKIYAYNTSNHSQQEGTSWTCVSSADFSMVPALPC